MMKHETHEITERAATGLPLLFTYKSPIFGRGFIADVEICGRVLAELAADGVWLYGVNPGGFAVQAPNLTAAGPTTTQSLTEILIDIAEEKGSFDEFKKEVERFFAETDESSVAEWKTANELARKGELAVPAGLRVIPAADAKFGVTITSRPITQVTPEINPVAIAEQQQRAGERLGLAA